MRERNRLGERIIQNTGLIKTAGRAAAKFNYANI